jgi:hypothetical protein
MAVIVLLPDNLLGDRVMVRLSDRHGPTAADTIGVVIALAGWGYYLGSIWRRRMRLQKLWLATILILVTLLALTGALLAAAFNQDSLLLFLGIVAFAAQLSLGTLARERRTDTAAGIWA